MKSILTTLLLIFLSLLIHAQDVVGTYRLHGIHDMAAGFEFNKDSSFRFYYSYGAADRFAEGTYIITGNKIILKSNKEPGKDFTVAKQQSDTNGYIIKIIDPNIYLAKYVQAIIINGNEKNTFEPDDAGIIIIKKPSR